MLFRSICREAIRKNAAQPIILNAANEEAVKLFLNEKITFCEIIDAVKAALDEFKNEKKPNSLKEILNIDEATRNFIKELL